MAKSLQFPDKAKMIKEQVSLPSVGKITVGNGTVRVSNEGTAISSEEMLESLKKASKKNFFPLKSETQGE